LEQALAEELFKAEALRLEEVSKVTDMEKALAKVEAACAEMIITISERDQVISGLRADLVKSKGAWKRATTHVETSTSTHTKKNLSKDHASEMKERDDLITILCMQLQTERSMLRKLRAQLHWVVWS
jgi:alpha-D-ribose 1-methylphosphonate 5-triphosphate diphosphatase PhnM